jgi:hypothetical protein
VRLLSSPMSPSSALAASVKSASASHCITLDYIALPDLIV